MEKKGDTLELKTNVEVDKSMKLIDINGKKNEGAISDNASAAAFGCKNIRFGYIIVANDAKKVKKKDLEHNSTITRLKGLRKADFDRLEKYSRSYVYLSD